MLLQIQLQYIVKIKTMSILFQLKLLSVLLEQQHHILGIYATPQKFLWVDLFGNVYGQYSTQIVGDILFHSVPYSRKYDKSSLIYSYYDKLGTSASAGCVRLTVEDAKWIYDNCELGTNVEFYDDFNTPGPLGKPSAQKISGNRTLRNWDPTDPDENNPWKKY